MPPYFCTNDFLQSFFHLCQIMDIHCLNERFTNKHLRVRILRCNLSD